MKRMFYVGVSLILWGLAVGCQQPADSLAYASATPQDLGTDATKVYNNVGGLSKIINLNTYTPTEVLYAYTYKDAAANAKTKKAFHAEALLYFDEATMKAIRTHIANTDFIQTVYPIEDFAFKWLSEDILNELDNSDPVYTGTPDFFFSSGGEVWLLKNKVLVTWSSE